MLAVEVYLFARMWYNEYADYIQIPFFRRGNWAVIGMYAVIIYLFTKLYGGYRVGFLRVMDVLFFPDIIFDLRKYCRLCRTLYYLPGLHQTVKYAEADRP